MLCPGAVMLGRLNKCWTDFWCEIFQKSGRDVVWASSFVWVKALEDILDASLIYCELAHVLMFQQQHENSHVSTAFMFLNLCPTSVLTFFA